MLSRDPMIRLQVRLALSRPNDGSHAPGSASGGGEALYCVSVQV